MTSRIAAAFHAGDAGTFGQGRTVRASSSSWTRHGPYCFLQMRHYFFINCIILAATVSWDVAFVVGNAHIFDLDASTKMNSLNLPTYLWKLDALDISGHWFSKFHAILEAMVHGTYINYVGNTYCILWPYSLYWRFYFHSASVATDSFVLSILSRLPAY